MEIYPEASARRWTYESKQEEGRSTERSSFTLNILRANGIGNVRQTLYQNGLSLDHLLARAMA